jgi:hypothetical protein
VITRSFLTMVRHRDRRQVSMFSHRFLANCSHLPRRVLEVPEQFVRISAPDGTRYAKRQHGQY